TAWRVQGACRLVDKLTLGADLAYADRRGSFTQRGNNTNGVQLGDLRQPPEFNPNPYIVQTPVGPQERAYRFLQPNTLTLATDRIFDNPYWALSQQINTSAVVRVYGKVNAEY